MKRLNRLLYHSCPPYLSPNPTAADSIRHMSGSATLHMSHSPSHSTTPGSPVSPTGPAIIPPHEPAALWSNDLLIRCHPNGLVCVDINRPKALNALNGDICRTLSEYLPQLDMDDRCTAILVAGTGGKAFCAGGDIRLATQFDLPNCQQFFSMEYCLDFRTALMRKPYLTIWNGIAMGGGMGLSMHGRYRIATDSTICAMPETSIGLFPDVGASHVLSRLKPDGLGLYLGLTGSRMNASDVMRHGLATHYVPLASMDAFIEAFSTTDLKIGDQSHQVIAALLEKFGEKSCPHIPQLLGDDVLVKIQKYFANAQSLQEVLGRLKADSDDDFCRKTAASIADKCPLSCATWFRQHQKGSKLSLADALRMEFLLVQSFVCFDENFKEGVRALLIDKDGTPVWLPKTIEEVQESYVDRMFECPGGESLDTFVQLPAA